MIGSMKDLRKTYSLIRFVEEDIRDNEPFEDMTNIKDWLIEMKRDVREYTHRTSDVERFIGGDASYTVLYPLPENIKTREEAEEYFNENERIEYRPTYYDCTGQAFTSWYYIFPRRDRFYVYHHIAFDV